MTDPGHWTLAFDCGTTSLKAAVFDPRGVMRAATSGAYRLHQDDAGGAEQDADEIWSTVVAAGRSALAEAGVGSAEIGAIAFAATWKAVLPLDGDGIPLSRASIWMDSRARDQARRLNETAGRFVGTGQEYWPRVMHLAEERREDWASAVHVVGLGTYLTLQATGVLANEPSDDFVFGSDAASAEEFAEIWRSTGLPVEARKRFVEPRPAWVVVGGLTERAAAEFGLAAGTPVYNGFGDLPAVMVGTGSAAPGRAHIYLGSSSWLVFAAETKQSPAPLSATLAEGLHAQAYMIQSGCLAYDWAVAQLYHAEKQELGSAVNALVNDDVAAVEPGSRDLLATHWLNGELPPLSKNARGLFVNLTPLHDRRHMVRAVMESVCYAHRAGYEAHLAAGGAPLDRVRVVGGGATSDVWMQILADVLQLPVEVPADPQSTGAYGVYLLTEIGAGRLESFADVDRRIVVDRRFEPDPAAGRTYSRLSAIHARLHGALHGIFTELNGDY